MYKNIFRGVINKKTGHALTISAGTVSGTVYTYHYKNNKRRPCGYVGCWPEGVKVIIKEYLQ